jgi:hypothetical protein
VRRGGRRWPPVDSCATSGREERVGGVLGLGVPRATVGCSRGSGRARLEVRECRQHVSVSLCIMGRFSARLLGQQGDPPVLEELVPRLRAGGELL